MTWIREPRMNPENDPQRWVGAMQRSGIPRRFWTADLSEVKGDNRWINQAITQPEAWAGKGYGFYIHGPFNSGKSAAAGIIARDFVGRCHVVQWLSVRDVPSVRFRETEASSDVNDRLQRAELLVLDDLGSERFRLESAAGAALEETIRILYEAQRPVVITSNKSWDEFAATYSPAFVSVVKRMVVPIALVEPWDERPNLGVRS